MVLDAAERAGAGATLDELVERVEELIPRTQVFGVLDTLEHLEKGGRIGGARALLGSLLSIKPVVSLVDGKVEEESKQRTRSRSLRYLADKAVELAPDQPVGGVQRRGGGHRRVRGHAEGRADRASPGGGGPRPGGRNPHRTGHHRYVHHHRRLTAADLPRPGGPASRRRGIAGTRRTGRPGGSPAILRPWIPSLRRRRTDCPAPA